MPYKAKFREFLAENWKFWLIFSVTLVVGLALSAWDWEHNPLKLAQLPVTSAFLTRILPKLGEALMIAAIIALVIDGISKRKLLDEFLRDISVHILGRRLPRELRDHVIDYLDVCFVRSNWEITYTITEIPEHPGFIKLVTRAEYDVENRSPFLKPYTYTYDVEESWFPAVGETSITWVKVSDFFQHKEGDADFVVTSADGFKKFSETVKLPPTDERKPRLYRCSAESVEYFKNGSTTPFIAYYPVMNTTLTIYYPRKTLAVDVNFSFRETEQSVEKKQKANYDQWIISKPILPGQGFFARWEPKQTDNLPPKTNARTGPETPEPGERSVTPDLGLQGDW